jgi:predicted small secreted protein
MKKVIGIIAVVLVTCVVCACKPNITKTVGNKTIQAVEWTCSKARSGISWCLGKIRDNWQSFKN